ncbi:MAG: hypothetical protein AB7Q00_03315 [Phycisphaerales bacterium]
MRTSSGLFRMRRVWILATMAMACAVGACARDHGLRSDLNPDRDPTANRWSALEEELLMSEPDDE